MAISFEILSNIVSVPSGRGWVFEINYMTWGDNEPKIDFRKWSEDHEKMGKGVSISVDEAIALFSENSAGNILYALTHLGEEELEDATDDEESVSDEAQALLSNTEINEVSVEDSLSNIYK